MVKLAKNIYTDMDLAACKEGVDKLSYGFSSEMNYSVVVVVDTFKNLSLMKSKIDKRTMFVVGVIESQEEIAELQGLCDAWLYASSVQKLPILLESYHDLIENRVVCRDVLVSLGLSKTHEGVHKENIGAIKTIMQQTTTDIDSIFKSRVNEMKAIHADAQFTEKQLSVLRESMQPQEFYDLEEAWESTRSIVSRTDEVIKAMFSFVTVLQCEDRLTQMMDGITSIMADDAQKIETSYPFEAAEFYELSKRNLQAFYTIQEQRDFVMGLPLRVDGCQGNAKEVASIDDIELF